LCDRLVPKLLSLPVYKGCKGKNLKEGLNTSCKVQVARYKDA